MIKKEYMPIVKDIYRIGLKNTKYLEWHWAFYENK